MSTVSCRNTACSQNGIPKQTFQLPVVNHPDVTIPFTIPAGLRSLCGVCGQPTEADA